MNGNSGGVDFVSLSITNLFVIIGWFFVFNQTLKIKNREDIRKNIDLVTKAIDDIFILCQNYYSIQNREHISFISSDIKAKFSLISHYLLMLRKENIGMSSEVSRSLTEFKLHATGGFFETIRFMEQESVPDWKSQLVYSAEELKFRIERSYFDWAHE